MMVGWLALARVCTNNSKLWRSRSSCFDFAEFGTLMYFTNNHMIFDSLNFCASAIQNVFEH